MLQENIFISIKSIYIITSLFKKKTVEACDNLGLFICIFFFLLYFFLMIIIITKKYRFLNRITLPMLARARHFLSIIIIIKVINKLYLLLKNVVKSNPVLNNSLNIFRKPLF